jgi:hypothetical protein
MPSGKNAFNFSSTQTTDVAYFDAKMKAGALNIYTIRSTFILHRLSDAVYVQKQSFRIHL